LPEWIEPLPAQPAVRTALVFGPEDNGLRQEELDVCRWIVRIPTTGEYDSFNLSQAALLVLYEVAKTLSAAPKPEPTRPLPTMNDYFQLDRLVAGVMTESGFLREGTAAPVPGTIRNLFRRLDLDAKEMGILLGLFGKIHRRLQRDSPPSD
jgi:tRNA C32,U32 (ribose-2'-O)-methylase TrmJ